MQLNVFVDFCIVVRYICKMETDSRGFVLTGFALSPGTHQRLHRLRRARGFIMREIFEAALVYFLDRLEGVPVGPPQEPQRFKRAGGTVERRVISPFAGLAGGSASASPRKGGEK